MAVKVDKRKLDMLARTLPEQLDSALRKAATEITTDIKLSFNTSPPGRVYGTHVASQSGFPPNVDTGTLRASITSKKIGPLHYRVQDGTEYGFYLEMILRRPFVRPVFFEWRQMKFADLIKRELNLG